MSLSYAIVIPARYESSRFPGKPLTIIDGKPMIQHVWERCCRAVDKELVYIATDNIKIANAVTEFGGKFIMTSSQCLTGTDRLAEANEVLNCDFIINVQGDEPLIDPKDIVTVINEYTRLPNRVINAMSLIEDEDEFRSPNIPKVVVSSSNRLMYMSRSPVPITKTGGFAFGYKQVCIYAFSKEHLRFFMAHAEKSKVEEVEDIEILRFIESDISVQMVEEASSSIAVDIPEDVNKVISKIKANKKLG